jgi:regulator of replication initiation timing
MSERMWLSEELESTRTERDALRTENERLREALREIDIAARQIIEGAYPIGTCLAVRARIAALKPYQEQI